MRALSMLCVTLLCLASCHGFFWNSRNIETTAEANGREIESSCLASAESGSCEFYSCFERRLPCGRDWYMYNHGRYYCDKMTQMKSQFDEAGQNFLSNAQQCMTQALAPYYSRDYMNCHTLEHDAVNIIQDCFIDNGFCGVLRTNRDAFSQIYEARDLFQPGSNKIWILFGRLSWRCATSFVRDSITGVHSSVVEHVNDAIDTISDHVDFDDAIDTISDHVDTISDAVQDGTSRIHNAIRNRAA